MNSKPEKTITTLEVVKDPTSKMISLIDRAQKRIGQEKVAQDEAKDGQSQNSSLNDLIDHLDNPEIRNRAISTLKALDELSGQSQSRIVTGNIREIRKTEQGKYQNLALEIAKLAYDRNPDNPFYLGELSVLLIHNGENHKVINLIHDFMHRIEQNKIQITDANKNYLGVDLAYAYSGIGDPVHGIEILNNLKSESPNVIEALAELYYRAGKPYDTIELLKDIKDKTRKMEYWLKKSQESALDGHEKSEPDIIEKEPKKLLLLEVPTYAIPDRAGGKDLLGFDIYAKALADFICHEKTEKPITIGIDAPWGMGKTFLMQMICAELINRKNIRIKRHRETIEIDRCKKCNRCEGPILPEETNNHPIWFNAWKYDKEESLWAALILEILRQLRQQSGIIEWLKLIIDVNFHRIEWERLIEKIVRIIIPALLVVLLAFLASVLTSIIAKYDIIDFLKNSFYKYELAWLLTLIVTIVGAFKYLYTHIAGPFDLKISQYLRESNYRERIGFLAQFEEDFNRMLSIMSKEGSKTVVIFIDDLDRCAPPKPVEIIEAINTLIDSKHCVFVIGMDEKAVASSIEAKYQDLRDYLNKTGDLAGSSLGRRFLDKIIQINFRIPIAEEDSISEFTRSMIPEIKIPQVTVKKSQKYETSIPRPDDINNDEPEYFAANFDNYPEVTEAIDNASRYLRANPRHIKKFMNSFRLLAFIANRKGLIVSGAIKLDLLAKWTVIQIRWPEIIDDLEADKNFIKNLREEKYIISKIKSRSGESIKNLVDKNRDMPEIISIPDQLQEDQGILNQMLKDSKISRMINEEEFLSLVDEFGDSIYNYIYLAHIA